MNALYYIANGFVLPPALHFAWNFYKFKGREIPFKLLWMSMVLFALTAVVTGLQFVFPEIIGALNRDGQAMASGEWWRLVTPLFIQPMGWGQCVFNAMFFVAFVPIAEYLYGWRMLLVYFVASIPSQLVILYWQTTPGGLPTGSGGSSLALFAVSGALFMYVALNRKLFPKGYMLIPMAGFIGATALVFFEDGHGASILLGGLTGVLVQKYTKRISPYPQSQPSEK